MQFGDSVTFVDSVGKEHPALVTNVFGAWGPENKPSINLVYVSDDESRTDNFGRQIVRNSSVVHESNQAAHGNYWK
jgi:hypothetical protein